MKRLLLVEDDAANRCTLAALLECEGYAVTEAGSFAEASKKIREEGFDVVVLDRGLHGHDGLDLVPFVLRSPVPARVVVLTGSQEVVELAGVHAWVVKGGDPSRLVDALQPRSSG